MAISDIVGGYDNTNRLIGALTNDVTAMGVDPNVIDPNTGVPKGLTLNPETNQWTDARGNLWMPQQMDPDAPPTWTNQTEMANSGLYPNDATARAAQQLGIQDFNGFASRAGSGQLTQDDIAKIGRLSSVAPQISNGLVTNASDFFSGAVSKAQDINNASNKGSFLGIKMDPGISDALTLGSAYLTAGSALADAPAGAAGGTVGETGGTITGALPADTAGVPADVGTGGNVQLASAPSSTITDVTAPTISSDSLGSGIKIGQASTGIGGDALGSGITPGITTETSGALGSGITGAPTSGALAPGFFPSETISAPSLPTAGGTGLTTQKTPEGQGLSVPGSPAQTDMGGASGLTAPSGSALGDSSSFINDPLITDSSGGTISGSGFTPTGATPSLGDTSSFINSDSFNTAVPSAITADANSGTATIGSSGPAILDATTPTANVSPETASLLGISSPSTLSSASLGDVQTSVGGVPGGAPEMGGAFSNGATGAFDQSGSEGVFGPNGEPLYESPVDANILKTLGLSPIQAGLLGLTGLNMANKPKLPAAGQTLANNSTTGAANAQSVIQSGGTSGPQWQTQKGAIDSAIDQQIKEQTEAMLQQAVNSGVGADSQVTKQQIDKLKTNLETKRQELYLAAQSQNVSAALQELGISDQALAHVTQAQFAADANAQQTASMMAELALLLGSKSG